MEKLSTVFSCVAKCKGFLPEDYILQECDLTNPPTEVLINIHLSVVTAFSNIRGLFLQAKLYHRGRRTLPLFLSPDLKTIE